MARFYLLAALTPNALILTCQLFWSAAQHRPPLPINRFRNSLLLPGRQAVWSHRRSKGVAGLPPISVVCSGLRRSATARLHGCR